MINHQLLNNNFLPNWKIKTLVLGTFNPEGGDIVDYFYGRNRNNFWKALAELQKLQRNSYYQNFEEKLKCMKLFEFGCTDIIRSVVVNENYIQNIIGNGYSDNKLFNLANVHRTYQMDIIKNYLIKNEVKKVINTWGKREIPNEFLNHVNDLNNFCNEHNIIFVDACPSPSPRSNATFQQLCEFYKKHLLN